MRPEERYPNGGEKSSGKIYVVLAILAIVGFLAVVLMDYRSGMSPATPPAAASPDLGIPVPPTQSPPQ
ncbi:hypothetical protein U0C82_01150 [Fulvimarina sp. 2208YS6-2-32]|uniref:Uncharacterized protein n=1 Tax=Fulvimarina uroteuthidis TaxID=3098149 RepID=A0ABU5HYW2_9HYPH|nr:hypothetical protein [Fulvimarina sp. 2208YS6-2-32]MDY8107753.1 hypothetical protein [Fulvimarina sp. 2208YS6-2-32]